MSCEDECCESFKVGVTASDAIRISACLGISIQTMFDILIDAEGNLKFKEIEDKTCCIFYDPDNINKGCMIQDIKPEICGLHSCAKCRFKREE